MSRKLLIDVDLYVCYILKYQSEVMSKTDLTTAKFGSK